MLQTLSTNGQPDGGRWTTCSSTDHKPRPGSWGLRLSAFHRSHIPCLGVRQQPGPVAGKEERQAASNSAVDLSGLASRQSHARWTETCLSGPNHRSRKSCCPGYTHQKTNAVLVNPADPTSSRFPAGTTHIWPATTGSVSPPHCSWL